MTVVNFTDGEQVSYLADQKMKYDYENVMEYAVEQAHDSGFSEGEAKGKAEGLAKGEAKGRLETARNLREMGLPIEQIVRATSLTRDAVSALK